jgi:hypothetical protein
MRSSGGRSRPSPTCWRSGREHRAGSRSRSLGSGGALPGTIARRARVGRCIHPRGPRPSDGRRGGRRGTGCRVGVGGAPCQDRRPGSGHPPAPSAGAQDPLDRRCSRARVRRDRVRGRIEGVAWWIADRVARGIRPDPRPSALRGSRIERPTKRARSERARGVALRRRPLRRRLVLARWTRNDRAGRRRWQRWRWHDEARRRSSRSGPGHRERRAPQRQRVGEQRTRGVASAQLAWALSLVDDPIFHDRGVHIVPGER